MQTAALPPATNPQRVRTYREQYDNLVANRPSVPRSAPVIIGMTVGPDKNKTHCDLLHQRIARIEAQARQLNGPQQQDSLRAERRKVQDEIRREC